MNEQRQVNNMPRPGKNVAMLQEYIETVRSGKTAMIVGKDYVVIDRKTYDATVPRWIPVEERLPEKMGYYICRMDAEPDLGTRTDIVFYAIREYGSMAVIKTGWVIPVLYEWANNTVTHWMPLPSPPDNKERL